MTGTRSGCSIRPLLAVVVCSAVMAMTAAAHSCRVEKLLERGNFSVSCGYRNKQIEVAIGCRFGDEASELDVADSWSQFGRGEKLQLDLWNVGTMKFRNCRVPASLSLLDDVVGSLNVSFIDTLYFDNLRSSLSRRNLRGFSVRVLKIIGAGASFRELPSDTLHDLAPDLKTLSIEETQLTAIPPGFFAAGWSANLQNISFINNTLRAIGRDDFSGLEEAQHLWLTYNQISDIELGAFDNLPSLRSLDISSNRMRAMPANLFRRLANIEAIHLGSNRFDQLPAQLLTSIDNCHLARFRMSYNGGSLASLPAGFFRNLSTLTYVELLHNQFTSLPVDLFAGATGLEQLDISQNNLTTLPAGIFDDTRKLIDLRIIDNQLQDLPEGIFRGLTDLERLYLNQNRLTNISSNILEGVDSVKIFQAAWNNISHIDSNFCQYVKVIQEINLMGNQLTLELQHGISVMVNCLFLKELIVSYNKISQIFIDWILSTSMELIDLQHNEITEFGAPQLHFLRNGLTIYLQNNKISTIDLRELENDTELYRSTNVENSDKGITVYLGDNPLNCDCRLIDFFRYFENKLNRNVRGYVEIYADFVGGEGRQSNVGFEGFQCAEPPELATRKIVDIRSEDLNCLVESDKKDDACNNNSCFCREYPEKQILSVDCSNNNLTKLPVSIANEHGWSIELDMSHNKLSQTPSLNSSYLTNVTSLDLSSNNISTVTLEVFSRNLRELNLHNNSISQLDQKVIEHLAEDKVIRKLTLHGNKWQCNCQARNFLSLVQKKLTSHELHEFMCYGSSRRLSSMTVNELCEGAIAIIVGASLLIAFFGLIAGSLAALYYRYQKEIKVWLYSKQCCLWFVTEDELDKDKKYDAFVSFSHKDEDFVDKEIIAKLEEGPRPYKLCLHYRDWLAGEWIPVQISRSVEESRRTVVILSPNFLESVWGRMEFRAAHTQALKEGRARLIVVLYGEIGNVDDLDPELKSYLSLNTYVKWGDPWFWDKLRYALPHRYESSKRKTRNARIIENHLAQVPVSNGTTTAPLAGKAEVIQMPKLTTSTNDSVKLLDSAAEDEKMVASC